MRGEIGLRSSRDATLCDKQARLGTGANSEVKHWADERHFGEHTMATGLWSRVGEETAECLLDVEPEK